MTDLLEPCPLCGGPRRMRLDVEVQRNGYTTMQPCTNTEFHKFVERDAAGYQYLSDKFEIIETTSMPLNDEQAFAHVRQVEKWFPGVVIKYISRREFSSTRYEMMPVQFDEETKEVKPIA